jgi:hypothetical protein
MQWRSWRGMPRKRLLMSLLAMPAETCGAAGMGAAGAQPRRGNPRRNK